ncbi:hypothetical protein ACI2IX_20070 [Leifsonia aquatica]|uniref:hypothetical protein n=1 Tax=Leifsonia aquatica TaxID=144185 RepID=UPI00384DEB7F
MRTAILGGESGKRGFFGGRHAKARLWLMGGGIVAGLVLSLMFNPWGLIALGVLPAIGYLLTEQTTNDTLLTRTQTKRRWEWRVKNNLHMFVPFDPDRWEELNQTAINADRKHRKDALRDIQVMRDTPDGVVGMSWLRSQVGQPGVQLHQPPFAEDYLAVTFRTAGMIEGIDSETAFDTAQAGFGRFTASLGAETSLARRVQTTARVLPADASTHSAWLQSRLDHGAVRLLAISYRQVIDRFRFGQLNQRNYITISWPIGHAFRTKAARRGEGRDGWAALMQEEIRQTRQNLQAAGFKQVVALTARQTMAVIRHLQLPLFDIDQVSDLSPYHGWLPSLDAWSYTTYLGEIEGTTHMSLARTARLSAGKIDTAERDIFWLDGLLTRMGKQIARTISFHQELYPQAEARAEAEADTSSDQAEQLRRAKAGALQSAEVKATQSAAERRQADLAPGSGIAGANWVGYITIAAGDKPALVDAVEAVEAAAAELGVRELDWLDTYQAAAAATTWPVGRGISPRRSSTTSRVRTLLSGSGPEEAL